MDDLVQVRSEAWFRSYRDENGEIMGGDGAVFNAEMAQHCGEKIRIALCTIGPQSSYVLSGLPGLFWRDWMFERLAGPHRDQEKVYYDVYAVRKHLDAGEHLYDDNGNEYYAYRYWNRDRNREAKDYRRTDPDGADAEIGAEFPDYTLFAYREALHIPRLPRVKELPGERKAYQFGDIVRVKSKEWMDRYQRDEEGCIVHEDGTKMTPRQQGCAGQLFQFYTMTTDPATGNVIGYDLLSQHEPTFYPWMLEPVGKTMDAIADSKDEA
jgi:hypothetical protein